LLPAPRCGVDHLRGAGERQVPVRRRRRRPGVLAQGEAVGHLVGGDRRRAVGPVDRPRDRRHRRAARDLDDDVVLNRDVTRDDHPASAAARRGGGVPSFLAVTVAGAAATLVVATVSPEEPGHYPTCPFLALTGAWCPGCGSLRALHAL